jgi:transitional endoplasmic reticulum ATPase
MVKSLRQSPEGDQPWTETLQRHIAYGQKGRALRLLEKVIERDMPLFENLPSVQENKRIAWLYRIDLLRDWGRLSEALAWTCLECELHPENLAAQILKDMLKESLHLQVKPSDEAPTVAIKKGVQGAWHGVAGMREVKAVLERDIILPLRDREMAQKFKVRLPRGVLFYGPPGCGKTFITRKLAGILNFAFIEVKPSDLASPYVHGGQARIGSLFEEAKKKAPALIFLDEFDAFVPNRQSQGVSYHYGAEVNEFLAQLNDCWKSKILVVGATNLIENLDPAVLRPGRMDVHVFIGPPDIEARLELIKQFMQDRPQKDMNWPELAEKTDFYTSAEIEHLIDEAAKYAFQERRPIIQQDIHSVMGANPPRLNKEKIEEMKKPIGFL